MKRKEILDAIRDILGNPNIEEDWMLAQVGVDTDFNCVEFNEFRDKLEDKFGISFTFEETEEIEDFWYLIDLIAEKIVA